jgi:ParB-like chromosome segregation protein Spo0J
MAAIDIAKALRLILDETGCTQEVLGRRLGWSSGQETVSRYVAMLDPELGLSKHAAQHITHQTVMEAKAGTGGDIKLAAQVLKKAADEELSTRQTRKVAEAVAAAPNALHQRKLLEHEYDPFIHDADRIREQVKRTPGKDPVVLGRQPRADEDWRKSPTVAQMLRYIQQYREDVKRMRDAVKAGKLAPEAKPFMVGKLRGLIQDIETLIALLEE